MENINIDNLFEKLKEMPHEEQFNEIEKYTIETLNLLAIKIYLHTDYLTGDTLCDLFNNLLFVRAVKLDDIFEWTVENKQKFLNVNDKFMQVFENAYNEAASIANDLGNRIENDDKFLMGYEIDIKINPYIFNKNNETDNNNIGFILSDSHSDYLPAEYFFGRLNFKDGTPIYLDKSTNWNIEYFGDVFKENYICYGIHELLDTHRWSFSDIININKFNTDIKVKYENYVDVN